MRLSNPCLTFSLGCFLLPSTTWGVPSSRADHDSSLVARISPRDDTHMHHGGHVEPLTMLNETEVLMYHSPTPPSYYTFDWEDASSEHSSHAGLMITHGVFMSAAFFVALPAAITLRSVGNSGHSFALGAFWVLALAGVSTRNFVQKVDTEYVRSSHGLHGYLVLLAAACLTYDSPSLPFRPTWPEYIGLTDEPQEFENDDFSKVGHHALPISPGHERSWSRDEDNPPYSARSRSSEDTLHDNIHHHAVKKTLKLSFVVRVKNFVIGLSERVLVFLGFAMLISGIVVYSGGCRGNYLNGCLAHLIKGGIFWSYGLVTFARFLGSFSEFGWAWNRVPYGDNVSAEFTESAVIFAYGITNTWMERFGAHAGDPFTTKQLQHIGIAIMFWFAGLVGMGIESKRVRRWLASSSVASVATSGMPQDAVAEPPSYAASFNPFPALVIGVTGAAMAAHFQTYLFQVQIHQLWGNLLVGFAVLRCLTYFFLWLNPPRSILPSRPPTEALGSFFLACGGLEFMFSTEELTIAAMRRGRDDVMMFMCVGIAMTCFAFCWTMVLVAFKGWLKSHHTHKVSFFTAA
ncbi:cytoplasmic protein [Flagelloscypha sp. PMI_526]|nr:cytoplasmic protein [Flagelloscypha sp. PMI_526]